jgi:UDP-N-acetylglucosamine--N-acetylmuramyl-(pentapeptide) pyrophosphoryl-undecaprenol N-acetylglucosamine transferase
MNTPAATPPRIAIACGGTGGHLFPGLAVASRLIERGCGVTLLVSPKEVDQEAVRDVANMEVVTLPAVGLKRGGEIAFVRGFSRSYRAAKRLFKSNPPQAALAMGGFTSAAPVLAARRAKARTFLHESNSIAGRANRWLSWVVNQAFIGFPSAAARLRTRNVTITGTPVRPEFRSADAAACRVALGLDPDRPVLLVMGGSQGASGINELVANSLPLIAERAPSLQWIHLAGSNDAAKLAGVYAGLNLRAVVHPYFHRMELALGAASVTISRAGASSLAEIAAMRLPSVLIPYPAATDDHQFHNARAMEASGAARLLEQKIATPGTLTEVLWDLIEKPAVREKMQSALAQWHSPCAAERIAVAMLRAVGFPVGQTCESDAPEIAPGGIQLDSPKNGGQRPASPHEPRRQAENPPGIRRRGPALKPAPRVGA